MNGRWKEISVSDIHEKFELLAECVMKPNKGPFVNYNHLLLSGRHD